MIYHHGFQFNSLGKTIETYSIDLSPYAGQTVNRIDIVAAIDALGTPDITNAETLFNAWIGDSGVPSSLGNVAAILSSNAGDGGHVGPYGGFDNIIWSTILKTGVSGHDRDYHYVKPNHVIVLGDHLWFQLNSNDAAHRVDAEIQYTITIG